MSYCKKHKVDINRHMKGPLFKKGEEHAHQGPYPPGSIRNAI